MSPRDAALAILDAWFRHETIPVATTLRLTDYQRDAASRIEAIIGKYRGAVLADAVGLGKTFVALAIIEQAIHRQEPVALVIPAALRSHWLRHLAQLHNRQPADVTIVSHTALSFGRVHDAAFGLVVVDEAHAFRNPRTRRYAGLQHLTHGTSVLLLTATPVNNRLDDLYHQVALFAEDHVFMDLGLASLRSAFKRAASEARAQEQVQQVLDAVMVRRSREHVSMPGDTLRFPTRTSPVSIHYDLLAAYGPAWPAVYHTLQNLRFAAFSNTEILGAAELIRLQMLKRLESSVLAFSTSVRRQLQINRMLLDALESGQWIRPASLRHLIHDDGSAQLTLHQLLTEPAPPTRIVEFAESARTDQRLLNNCVRALDGALRSDDPKLTRLQSLLPGLGRALVFTQYRDTAQYLWNRLIGHARVGLIHGSEARLGAQRAARSTVIECFAPAANRARQPPERLRLDVLIATDVLSEGLNLQDAAAVISYDLPWNPVTLMQRIGRIDRLGSPHESIAIYNFLPDRGLDAFLGLMKRVETKLHVIGRAVGVEPVLTDLSHLQQGVRVRAADPLNQVAQRETLRSIWLSSEQKPARARTRATLQYSRAGWLVAVQQDARLRTLIIDENGIRDDAETFVSIIHAALNSNLPSPKDSAELPINRVRDWLIGDWKAKQLQSPPSSASAQAEAVRLLLALVNADTSADLLRRTDRIVRKLQQPLSSKHVARLKAELSLSEGVELRTVVSALEGVFADRAAHKSKRSPRFRVVGVIRLVGPPVLVDPTVRCG